MNSLVASTSSEITHVFFPMEVKMGTFIERSIKNQVVKDLGQKVVFLAGPRRSGKTTFVKNLFSYFNITESDARSRYLNWDSAEDREMILKHTLPTASGLIVLDEINKYPGWRNLLNGFYDKGGEDLKLLITGSAKLDCYKRGGDFLQGKYHYIRLHPLSLVELPSQTADDLTNLLTYGGFPEPFFLASETETKHWSRDNRLRLLKEDLLNLEQVSKISLVEQLMIRLPALVGNPLSLNGLREYFQISHQTVSRWLLMLENVYDIFRIHPFGAPSIRAIKTEDKHYHFDWTQVSDAEPRFENLVACHLLKWCHFLQDTEGLDIELRYFRDLDKREVDFVILKNQKPEFFIECKLSSKEISPSLRYLSKKFPLVKAIQLCLDQDVDVITKKNIRLCHAATFLRQLV